MHWPEDLSGYRPKNTTHMVLRLFLLVTVIASGLLIIFRAQVNDAIQQLSHSLLSTSCPETNKMATIFEEHYEYQTWDPSADHLWDALITPNGGFIIDENNGETQLYGIAMFHQLHCVQMIRNDFQELYARLDGRSDGINNVLHMIDGPHLLHCLDYLRQVCVGTTSSSLLSPLC
jgi:hypothetical protein